METMTDLTPSQASPRLWTIGHGDRDFDSVAATLHAHGVQTIVDVRSTPYSRVASEFTKHQLEDAAASAGFGYRWMGRSLGGKPPAGANEFNSGIDELSGLCATSHVALLCAELDPVHCHRDSALAPALAARGFHVIHILADGTGTLYQEHLELDH